MVFDAITNAIETRGMTDRRVFSYTLPRACGTTSFLTRLAKTEALRPGTRVAYFTLNNSMVHYVMNMMNVDHKTLALDYDSIIDVLCWRETDGGNIRGRGGYDVMIFDDVDPKNERWGNSIIASILAPEGYSIHINSV